MIVRLVAEEGGCEVLAEGGFGWESIDYCLGAVVRCGLVSGRLSWLGGDKFSLSGSTESFVELVEAILSYGPNQIDEARESMELSEDVRDTEIAYLDWELRECLADEARSARNVWGGDQIVAIDAARLSNRIWNRYFDAREKRIKMFERWLDSQGGTV